MINNITMLDLPNPRKIRVGIDRNWLYTTVVDPYDASSEVEDDPNFTNINASTGMGDNTAPPTRPTYNEGEISTKNQDIWY